MFTRGEHHQHNMISIRLDDNTIFTNITKFVMIWIQFDSTGLNWIQLDNIYRLIPEKTAAFLFGFIDAAS